MAIYEKELISEKIKNNKTMNWKEYINVMMVRLFMKKI